MSVHDEARKEIDSRDCDHDLVHDDHRIACVDCEERYPEDALNSSNVCDDCMERRREDRDYASECEGHGAWLRRQQ